MHKFCILLLILVCAGCGRGGPRVVVYCALDREFAEDILKDFEKETGIEAVVRFDSEANKSVGLYEDLVREQASPRCDVHWNNEILATIRLQEQGVLTPYASPAAADFAAPWKAKDQTWTAFAARVRVLAINTRLLPDKKGWPRSLNELAEPAWKGKVALAKPQFGTTASHTACLFAHWGSDEAKRFLRRLKENDAQLLPGNKQVALAVGRGDIPLGLTDTDDALAEIAAGNPVEMIFLEHRDPRSGAVEGPLLIPNTVALIKGCPNPDHGKKLIDYLLSPEVELKLARAKGKQIPLNPKVNPGEDFVRPATFLDVDFPAAARRWEETQKFVADELGWR
jgi:iron(III) transport system substrate-binding protein